MTYTRLYVGDWDRKNSHTWKTTAKKTPRGGRARARGALLVNGAKIYANQENTYNFAVCFFLCVCVRARAVCTYKN